MAVSNGSHTSFSAVGNDGTVSVVLPGNPQPQAVGQIQLASFINPAQVALKKAA